MSNIGPLIDEYGLLKAQIADLELKCKPLYDQIVAQGKAALEGAFYRVTVSTSERSTLDMRAARRKLSPQFIRANTTKSPVTTVRVSSRSADGIDSEAA